MIVRDDRERDEGDTGACTHAALGPGLVHKAAVDAGHGNAAVGGLGAVACLADALAEELRLKALARLAAPRGERACVCVWRERNGKEKEGSDMWIERRRRREIQG